MQLIPRPQLNKKLSIESEQQQAFEQPRVRVIENPNVSNDDQERVAIFIDASNLFYAATHLNVEIDYTKLLRCLIKSVSCSELISIQ